MRTPETWCARCWGTIPGALTPSAPLPSYNQNPYDLSAHVYTFAEVYELWSEQHFKPLAEDTIRIHRSAYKACAPLHDQPLKDIRLMHLQQMIDNSWQKSKCQNAH